MKAYVIAFNRLHLLRQLCEQLETSGLEVVIIDNASTYPPLLLWYEMECPYQVIAMTKNYGHQVLFTQLPHLLTDKYFILTDHDLDLSGIPSDWVEVLKQGLIDNPDVIKSGLSLRITDLPVNDYTKEVISWEKKYWERPKRGNFYLSEIDTTLAMYDKDRHFGKLPNNRFFSAVRSDIPYCCAHRPWYNTKESIEADPEEKYYNDNTHTYWSSKFKELI